HFQTERRDAPIHDMRTGGEFSLDTHGFALRTAPTDVDLYDDEAVERDYHPELEALLKAELGATRVVVFDATRRSSGKKGAANKDGQRNAARMIHVDYTPNSGPQRAKDMLGEDEFDRLRAAGARMVQINVWRPTVGPVRRAPLAVADAASIPAEDLITAKQYFPDRVGEIYFLAHSDTHRWWYAPEMTTGEVLLIKGWDTADDGRAIYCPHAAFPLPDQDDAPTRESIEVRTLAIIE
ncbi:MAG: CmcJ/NvfI family oxidoreductase, partial [Pseudomonadota bacterium]